MDSAQAVIQALLDAYQEKGYVTEDEIFDACDDSGLALSQIDYVSNQLLDKGVLIGDAPVQQPSRSPEAVFDYSQTDYDVIYRYFRKHYPGMRHIIKQIKKTIPPQKGETDLLLTQVRSGNQHARDVLVQKYMRNALKSAYSYREKTTIPLEDLFSVAVMGVITAVDSYDPTSLSPFLSYCNTWMMQFLERYINNNETIIRVPNHLSGKIKQIRQWRVEYSGKELLLRIQSEFSVTESEAQELIACSELDHIQSLNQMMKRRREPLLYDAFNMDEILETHMQSEAIRKAFKKLSDRERNVLVMRYGLDGDKPMTLEEVGAVLSVTRERVRQMEAKAFRKLWWSPHLLQYSEEIRDESRKNTV